MVCQAELKRRRRESKVPMFTAVATHSMLTCRTALVCVSFCRSLWSFFLPEAPQTVPRACICVRQIRRELVMQGITDEERYDREKQKWRII